jgi:hypothetical protein
MTPEETFNEIWSGLSTRMDFDRFPNFLFFFKGDICNFELNLKTDILWCSYRHVWNIFYDKYSMEYGEIQEFIKRMVEQHLNKEIPIPKTDLNNSFRQVEEHFKQVTHTKIHVEMGNPIMAEEHFNQVMVTPLMDEGLGEIVVEKHFNKIK